MPKFTKIRNDKVDLIIKTEKMEENHFKGTTLYTTLYKNVENLVWVIFCENRIFVCVKI